ncbi:MAG: DUF2807 domain-containing protein [FCB group bacterium]
MNNIFKIICLATLSFILASCNGSNNTGCDVSGDGKIVNDNRTIDSISSIYFTLAGNLHITQGQLQSLVITSDDNITPEISTTVSSNELKIKSAKSLCPTSLDVNVTMAAINNITFTGSGSISSVGNINGADISVNMSGSGNITFTGKAHSCYSQLDGTGNILLDNLETVASTAILNGSGNIKIWVDETLEAVINGSGNIYYKGNPSPSNIHITINGSGNVIHLPS